MLVPVVLDHAVAAYADVWARDLHPSQGDPGDGDSRAGAGARKGEEPRPVCAPPPTSSTQSTPHPVTTHRLKMSSSSPPQPQYSLGKPLILRNWDLFRPDTPPK